MFAYDDLVQWCKDMRSAQIARRNRAWNFQHAHGIDPCDVAWNADAIRWVDGMVYVVSRNVKRNGELGERYTVVTAEQWLDMHRVPGVVNAQAVRGVAAAYRADGGVWLDPNGPDYAQAVSEIGDVPLIVERGDCMVSSDCGDYTAHGVSLSDADREHGWELSYEHGGMVVSRDISFLTPAECDHPEMCETYDDLPVVAPEPQSVEPEPDTVEIPEVPPIPSKDTPKVIAQHGVKARVVTIPGGKSVKELADVFGGYVHKPRGFRDSKGRRVAYVAFDGKSGVVAYRDYYQRGSDQTLEESVAAYLAQHEIVEVA